jgi:hypothetical protein
MAHNPFSLLGACFPRRAQRTVFSSGQFLAQEPISPRAPSGKTSAKA